MDILSTFQEHAQLQFCEKKLEKSHNFMRFGEIQEKNY